ARSTEELGLKHPAPADLCEQACDARLELAIDLDGFRVGGVADLRWPDPTRNLMDRAGDPALPGDADNGRELAGEVRLSHPFGVREAIQRGTQLGGRRDALGLVIGKRIPDLQPRALWLEDRGEVDLLCARRQVRRGPDDRRQ